jgi:hypothetical protein
MAQKNVLVLDEDKNQINVASEESLMLLKRIVKLLESNATVDFANRQRVVVDVAPSTAVTLASLPVANQFTYEAMDRARQSYALGIRNNLQWTA